MKEFLDRGRNSISALVILAGASLAVSPAIAGGDIGGSCCADLEERVAELEETTARKGNRKVSLTLYGQVNRAVMHWDDGVDSDAYVVDNIISSSRFGMYGSARIRPGWSAGYKVEIEFDDAESDAVSQTNNDGGGTNNNLDTRLSYWWIKSDRYGTLRVGQEWHGSADVAAQDLSGTTVIATPAIADNGGGLDFRTAAGAMSGITFGSVASNLVLTRGDIVRYDTPTVGGFTLSASWGEDDVGDVGLYFGRTLGNYQVAAAVGYVDSTDGAAAFEQWAGSLSILHVPTGLNLSFAGGDRDTNGSTLDQDYWYVKAGLIRKWNSLGKTAISVDYYHADEMAAATGETTHWGVQYVQNIDAAAMQWYSKYSHNEYDTTAANYQDIDIFMTGARIKF